MARLTRTDLLLLLMAVIWGVNYSVVKRGAQLLPPLTFNAVRIAIACAVLLTLATLRGHPWPRRDEVWRLIALGFVGNGLYQAMFIGAVANTRAGNVAIVLASSPAWLAIAGRVRGVEHVSRRTATGILASIAGVAAVVLGTSTAADAASPAPVLGNTLALAGTLTWAAYTVLLDPLTRRTEPLQLAGLTMLGGAVPLLLVTAPQIADVSWRAVTLEGWGAIFYGSMLALVVAYLIWYHGVRVLGPTRTALYANLQPLIAVIAAAITLGEVPAPAQLAGGVAIMAGLLLTRTRA